MNKKAEKYLLSLVKNGYENIADSFNQTRKKPMKPMIYKIVDDLKIKADDKVLDLGCGNGCFFEALDGRGKYLGVDNSEELIKYARSQYGDKFAQIDITKLNKLEENNFSFIFSWAVLHHIPGEKLRLKILNQIYDKLAPGGIFAFSVWNLRQRKNFFQATAGLFFRGLFQGRLTDFGDMVFNWKGQPKIGFPPRYYHAFSKEELEIEIKKTKFEVENFLRDDFNYYFILKK